MRFNFLAVGSIDDMSIIPLLLCFFSLISKLDLKSLAEVVRAYKENKILEAGQRPKPLGFLGPQSSGLRFEPYARKGLE